MQLHLLSTKECLLNGYVNEALVLYLGLLQRSGLSVLLLILNKLSLLLHRLSSEGCDQWLCLRCLCLIGSASRCVCASLARKGSLLLEHLLLILFPKLHSVVFAFSLKFVVITRTQIESFLDSLLRMVHMLLLFGLLTAAKLETILRTTWLWLRCLLLVFHR